MIITFLILAAAWPEPVDSREAEGRPAMASYADCVARRHRKLAEIVADVDPGEFSTKDRLAAHRSECLIEVADALRSDHWQYRFSVAEALLRRTYGKTAPDISGRGSLGHPVPSPDTPMPADWISRGGNAEAWPEFLQRERHHATVSGLGDCVVRAKPQESWRLLFAKINSSEELAAMTSLQPAVSGCLTNGAQIKLTKNHIRGMIALNYYRLAKAPRVASGGAR